MAVLLLPSCNKKDDSSDSAFVTYDPLAQSSEDTDSDAWWEQYTTEPDSTVPVTDKNGNTVKSTKGSSSKTTTKKNSSSKTTKSSSDSGSATEYTKVDSNTMKYANTNGGTTTLTKDASNTYIKQTISALSSAFSDTKTAANMMCYSDSSNSTYTFVFVYTKTSGKSIDNLKYVAIFGSKGADMYPYADSGDDTYNSYRSTYIDSMSSATYNEVKANFKELHSDSNVQTFLSW